MIFITAIDYEEIKEYLSKLKDNERFLELEESEKEKVIFSAFETLKDFYREKSITTRVIALQVLYGLEGDYEEFERLKRQGVSNYSVKDVSVSFDKYEVISPVVIKLMNPNASTGRLI